MLANDMAVESLEAVCIDKALHQAYWAQKARNTSVEKPALVDFMVFFREYSY